MNIIKKYLSMAAVLIAGLPVTAGAQTPYKDGFLKPTDENRPLIIWQWMDGLVTKEGITKDLETFKAAGLAGVHNFQIGGNMQSLVGDPTCAIGSEKWKTMMRWAMEECRRLGLSFGTHNCPGWSSSAYGNVTPEYSMQKLVFSETRLTAEDILNIKKRKTVRLPRPDVDPKYDYYEDIAVLAMPADSTVGKDDISDGRTSLFLRHCHLHTHSDAEEETTERPTRRAQSRRCQEHGGRTRQRKDIPRYVESPVPARHNAGPAQGRQHDRDRRDQPMAQPNDRRRT